MSKQKERIERANRIINICKGKPEGIAFKVLISIESIKSGIANRYVREIIADLVNVGQLKLFEGDVFYDGK